MEQTETLYLFGEKFEVTQGFIPEDDYKIYLSHKKWSLVGKGNTLEEAQANLIQEAKDVAPYYIEMSDDDLTFDAIDFKRFLQKVVDEL